LFYLAEEGYSIFIAGLPSRSTAKMVGEEFQKFGAIKAGGIQVRNSKVSKIWFCLQLRYFF
jgi:hypothetical protein